MNLSCGLPLMNCDGVVWHKFTNNSEEHAALNVRLLPQRWRQDISLKQQSMSMRPHDVIPEDGNPQSHD